MEKPRTSVAFTAADPFPLLPPEAVSYAAAQSHAQAADAWLGLDTEKVERELLRRYAASGPGVDLTEQPWIGLPVRALLTPYLEIRQILALLAPTPGQTIVDLGAGYGRMGFVLGEHYPEVRFVGYELLGGRVTEALRSLEARRYKNIQLLQADLSQDSFEPVLAECYFLYDFGSRSAIEKTLQDLRRHAQTGPITVVGRGRATRDAIERAHPWLSQVCPPRHFEHFSIYRSG